MARSKQNSVNDSNPNNSKKTIVTSASSARKTKAKEYIGNLVVLNKLQGSLLIHLKDELQKLICG